MNPSISNRCRRPFKILSTASSSISISIFSISRFRFQKCRSLYSPFSEITCPRTLKDTFMVHSGFSKIPPNSTFSKYGIPSPVNLYFELVSLKNIISKIKKLKFSKLRQISSNYHRKKQLFQSGVMEFLSFFSTFCISATHYRGL